MFVWLALALALLALASPAAAEGESSGEILESIIDFFTWWIPESEPTGTVTILSEGEALGTVYAVDYKTSPPYGSAPLMVRFTAVNETDVEYTHWDFGDGYSSTERDHWHTYESPGTYTATLTVGNATWSQTAEFLIEVEPPGVVPLPTDAEEMF
jgi:PKD repeat protein